MDTHKRKYEDALERAIIAHKDEDRHLKATLEGIFPELKKYEDEWMCNIAINACKYMMENFENSTKQYEEAIAWLEKQGEQKPTDKVEPKFNVGDAIKITGINNGHTGYSILNTEDGYYYNWKLIDKKTAWSEEDELVVKDIEEAITNYWHGQTQEDLLDRLKSIKQRIGG